MKKETGKTGPGRPPLFGERMMRLNVMLTAKMREHLVEIGNGNVSEGIRRLLHWHEGITGKP